MQLHRLHKPSHIACQLMIGGVLLSSEARYLQPGMKGAETSTLLIVLLSNCICVGPHFIPVKVTTCTHATSVTHDTDFLGKLPALRAMQLLLLGWMMRVEMLCGEWGERDHMHN